MQGLANILYLFCNEFNKIKNTRARMLDSINHNYDIKITLFSLSSWCLETVVRLFLAVPWVCLRFVFVYY